MTPRIFLCEPSSLSPSQRALSDRWHERLFGLGFDVDQVRSDSYSRDPWKSLIDRITTADGALVLGFGQMFIASGTWRDGSPQQSHVVGATWTSSWLQAEVGIALAAGVPVLVAPELGVSEGVFAPETWTGPVLGTGIDTPDVRVVEAWAARVAVRSRSSAQGRTQ